MTVYNIDYTDPLKPGFSIAPGAFNGPGGADADTTLRLYGRSSLEWGEAVNENFVRLTESFAGATAPLAPVSGQVWVQQYVYWQNEDVVLPSVTVGNQAAAPAGAFYRYNMVLGFVWETDPTFTVVVINDPAGTPTSIGTEGQHVFNLANSTLYMWDSPYKQASPQWMPRIRAVASTASPINGLIIPVDGVTTPQQIITVYNSFTDEWVNSSSIATQDVDYNGFTILNLASQTYPEADSNNAATINYVNDGIAAAINLSSLTSTLDGTYVNVSGDTMTGFLTLNADPTALLHAATKQYVDDAVSGVSGALDPNVVGPLLDPRFVNITGDTMTGNLAISAPAPALFLYETDQALPGGRRRLVLDSNALRLDTNTAAGGDFSTYATHIAIDASGRFGINTGISPAYPLDVTGKAQVSEAWDNIRGALHVRSPSGGTNTGITLYTQSGHKWLWYNENATGSTSWWKTSTLAEAASDYVVKMTLTSGGNLIAAGNVTAFSDAKLKTDVQTIDNALETVRQLRGVSFKRIDDETNKQQIGVIAQEIEKYVPEVVIPHDNGTLSVAYGNLVGLLIEAIKELDNKVKSLENK